MWFDPGIIDVFRNTLPGLENVFLFISQFGSQIFFVGLLLVGYWAYNKQEAIIATYVLLIAVVSNYWIKYAIAHDRPPSSYWTPGAETPNYSTPSGHAQFSATLFGCFIIKIRRWWMVVIGVVMSFLIGISRIYLGVHYLEDILLGWGIGILTIVIFFLIEKPAREYLSKFKFEYLMMVLFVIGLSMTVIASLIPAPPNDNFGAIGGLTMGLAVGLCSEKRFVRFTVEAPNGQKWRLVLRVVIGLILVLGLMLGLEGILPSADILLRTIRYFLVSFVGLFVWPWIFKRINL